MDWRGEMMICLLPMRLTRLGPEVLEMEQVYQEHHDRFNRSDQRLNNLIGKMKNYVSGIGALMQTGESLAEQVVAFFKANNRGMSMVTQFCATHRDLKRSFVESFEKEFSMKVLLPIEEGIQRDMDDVKKVTEERNEAYEEVVRKVKLLRMKAAFKAKNIAEAERSLKESKDRLALLQSEAMHRFDSVERNLSGKVYECIRNLAIIQEHFAKSMLLFAQEAARIVITEEQNAIGQEPFAREKVHTVEKRPRRFVEELEQWDERYEHEPAVVPGAEVDVGNDVGETVLDSGMFNVTLDVDMGDERTDMGAGHESPSSTAHFLHTPLGVGPHPQGNLGRTEEEGSMSKDFTQREEWRATPTQPPLEFRSS